MTPIKVSAQVGVKNFDRIGAIFIDICAKDVLLCRRIIHENLRQSRSISVYLHDLLKVYYKIYELVVFGMHKRSARDKLAIGT